MTNIKHTFENHLTLNHNSKISMHFASEHWKTLLRKAERSIFPNFRSKISVLSWFQAGNLMLCILESRQSMLKGLSSQGPWICIQACTAMFFLLQNLP